MAKNTRKNVRTCQMGPKSPHSPYKLKIKTLNITCDEATSAPTGMMDAHHKLGTQNQKNAFGQGNEVLGRGEKITDHTC